MIRLLLTTATVVFQPFILRSTTALQRASRICDRNIGTLQQRPARNISTLIDCNGIPLAPGIHVERLVKSRMEIRPELQMTLKTIATTNMSTDSNENMTMPRYMRIDFQIQNMHNFRRKSKQTNRISIVNWTRQKPIHRNGTGSTSYNIKRDCISIDCSRGICWIFDAKKNCSDRKNYDRKNVTCVHSSLNRRSSL